ncbi:MAG: DNA primase DnaG [Candidatus Micrarchaeota archaeon]
MGKTYIDTVKYLIYTEIEIDGLVDKPDVVGAIFGQTEGLLGDDLDLRDLQKNGRIGRIEVDLNIKNGKTFGIIKIPSSLDMVETSIIAASLEAVDRVGPCEGKMRVQKIEDTRNQKRKILVDRAKVLLKNMLNTEIPESKEIGDLVREQVKIAEVIEYGPDKLCSGPLINKLNEIILVEGRADVINMIKNDFTNVISIGGAKVPKTIVELSREKEVIAFLDGDRGGDIILNALIHGGVEIDFVARAPAGKEVEELTRKEIIKLLRSKIPFEQIEDVKAKPFAIPYQTPKMSVIGQQIATYNEQLEEYAQKTLPQIRKEAESLKSESKSELKPESKTSSVQSIKHVIDERVDQIIDLGHQIASQHKTLKLDIKKSKDELMLELNELNNTLKARFYSEDGTLIKEVPVRDVLRSITETEGVKTIIFDGIITQRLVDVAMQKGVTLMIGMKLGNVSKKHETLEIITKNK